MNRRVAAAEWLCLWVCVFLGLSVVPAALALVMSDPADPHRGIGPFMTEYYSAVFGAVFGPTRAYSLFMMALVLSPYLLFQWVRSIVWAVQTLRERA